MVIHDTVREAIHAVMMDLTSLGKTDRNQAQNFSFRGVDAVVNAVGPLLREHGLVVWPVKTDLTFDTIQTSNQRSMGHAIAKVTYRWETLSTNVGTAIECEVVGEAFDAGDKAIPKAMSVAYRTMFLQTLCLPTDEPDPDASSYNRNDQPATDDRKPTKAMTGRMWAGLTELGYNHDTDRDNILQAMSGIVGRTVESSKDLSRGEVQAVIASIEQRLKHD